MGNELEGLAKSLADTVGGKGGMNFEKLIKLFSTDSGKKILASLLADGGERVKRAASGAKSGDMSGVQGIISSISETDEGKQLLAELMRDAQK